MPLLLSSFTPARIVRSAHTQTILPTLLRRPSVRAVPTLSLATNDGDVLLYRLYRDGHDRLAVISHGLEGSFDRSYVRGMVRSALRHGWDVLTWNMRGCGGVPNQLSTWYHSGKSEDLRLIVSHALTLDYRELALIGFSVGGNITLKYLGEEGGTVAPRISSAVTLSVPMDLQGSAEVMAHPSRTIYMRYLLRPLRRRMREKHARFPGQFDLSGLSRMRTFHQFDHQFTAPFHGFSSVAEYWETSSSIRYLERIAIPTLAISAQDDPFLSPSCFPFEIARSHPNLFLETPAHGGHVGFFETLSLAETWAEQRSLSFLNERSALR